jgi:curved DNA-binding protein CbpA
MNLNEGYTFYDILDITPDASSQEIRAAYLRTKKTYNRDSVALYTLIQPEEREQILQQVEEAYAVLSSPDMRREYDQSHGFLPIFENPFARKEDQPVPQNVVSIDRVPPMEHIPEGDDLFIPPTTDFQSPQSQEATSQHHEAAAFSSATPPAPSIEQIGKTPFPQAPAIPRTSTPVQYRTVTSRNFRTPGDGRLSPTELGPEMSQAIETEVEWKGSFLKKIRDAYKISIEEMCGITKLTKTYIIAIEEENFSKLPAPVYVRGFVMQIAKVLKLPHEKVAAAYMPRLLAKRTE